MCQCWRELQPAGCSNSVLTTPPTQCGSRGTCALAALPYFDSRLGFVYGYWHLTLLGPVTWFWDWALGGDPGARNARGTGVLPHSSRNLMKLRAGNFHVNSVFTKHYACAVQHRGLWTMDHTRFYLLWVLIRVGTRLLLRVCRFGDAKEMAEIAQKFFKYACKYGVEVFGDSVLTYKMHWLCAHAVVRIQPACPTPHALSAPCPRPSQCNGDAARRNSHRLAGRAVKARSEIAADSEMWVERRVKYIKDLRGGVTQRLR